jgi:hypothetical protein
LSAKEFYQFHPGCKNTGAVPDYYYLQTGEFSGIETLTPEKYQRMHFDQQTN